MIIINYLRNFYLKFEYETKQNSIIYNIFIQEVDKIEL